MMNPPSLTTASDDDGSDADERGGAAGNGPAMSDSDSAGQVSDDDGDEVEAEADGAASRDEGNAHGGGGAGGAVGASSAAGGGYLCALVSVPCASAGRPGASPNGWQAPARFACALACAFDALDVARGMSAVPRRRLPAAAAKGTREAATSHWCLCAQEYERQTKPSSLSWKSIKMADEERVAACMQKLPRLCAAGEACQAHCSSTALALL